MVACCRDRGTECSNICMGFFERVTIIYITSTIVWPQVNSREGTQSHPSKENWTKDLLSMALSIRKRPSFLLSVSPIRKLPKAPYPSPSEGRQTEKHSYRKLTNLITWATALSNSNYEPCHVGPPKRDGSRWGVLTKCGPLEKGMTNHFRILALRSP